jgi:transcriptional regulator with XRE-family HTH domain
MLEGRRLALLHPSNIRLARLEKRLDQANLASQLKISESTFGAIERARRLVKKDAAEQIAKILARPVTLLFKPQGKKKFIAVIAR